MIYYVTHVFKLVGSKEDGKFIKQIREDTYFNKDGTDRKTKSTYSQIFTNVEKMNNTMTYEKFLKEDQ